MARVTLRITGTQLLCQDEHPSLLAALESHNVAVEYQCREGYCGSCRTRLVAGQVDWIAEPLAFILYRDASGDDFSPGQENQLLPYLLFSHRYGEHNNSHADD